MIKYGTIKKKFKNPYNRICKIKTKIKYQY